MIHVVASITIKSGYKEKFLEIFKSNVSNVRKEKGCIEYQPTVDYPMGWSAQVLNDTMVTVIEKWESPDALNAHNEAPHMKTYREKVTGMVEKVEVRILQDG